MYMYMGNMDHIHVYLCMNGGSVTHMNYINVMLAPDMIMTSCFIC